ncbi:MAG TPA: hypothetical protein VK464_05765, partial [Symbiobacteriaceae bacterium]|nr:hypothetical protein [Symbiobacteriaceae bacterium]
MQAKWRWIAAGTAAALIVGAALAAFTPTGQKAIRYAERRTGWGPEGRRARTEALWQQARAEFEQAPRGMQLGAYDYPTKATLLANRAETLARVMAALSAPNSYEAFYLDLLGALEPQSLQAFIRQELTERQRYWDARDLRALFTDDQLKEMALQIPGWTRYTLVQALRQDPDQSFFEQYFLAQPDQRLDYLQKP